MTPPPTPPPLRLRVIVAVGLAMLSAIVCYAYSSAFRPNAGDIAMPLCMARAVIEGDDAYTRCQGFQSDGVTPNTANPITTALIVMPLLVFPPQIAAALFIGLSTGLLSFGLTRGGLERLIVLLAFPYWQAVQVVQWSPMLFATALLPALLPLTLAKPHLGAPIALTRLTLWRAVACAALLGVSLLLVPTWPWRMLGRIGAPGDYQSPILMLPLGPALALALLRWRSPRARLLLLLALVPQRTFYDCFLLWLIPETRRETLVLVVLSWVCYYAWYLAPGIGGAQWVLWLLYLPSLAMVLWSRPEPAAVG